jgi:hypothetical protein
MGTIFLDKKGVLIVEFTKRDHYNIRSVSKNIKKKLHRAIQNKRRGMLTSCVGLLHDNARPHTAVHTRALLMHFELFDHPPYHHDLPPSDYHLFTYLKNWLRSQRFNYNELMGGFKRG